MGATGFDNKGKFQGEQKPITGNQNQGKVIPMWGRNANVQAAA